MPEYEAWKEANNNGKGWKIKYYKVSSCHVSLNASGDNQNKFNSRVWVQATAWKPSSTFQTCLFTRKPLLLAKTMIGK